MTSKVQYDEVTEKRPAKSGSSTKRFTEKVNAEVFLIDRDSLSSHLISFSHRDTLSTLCKKPITS